MFDGRHACAGGLLVLALSAVPAVEPAHACGAQIRVTFVEASPDIFVVEFLDGPEREINSLRFDLSRSHGGAFVDTAYGGSQSGPSDTVQLERINGFTTGSQTGQVFFRRFPSGSSFNLLVDLDDNAVGGDENRNVLDGRELEGGEVHAQTRNDSGSMNELRGTFDATGIALLGNLACS